MNELEKICIYDPAGANYLLGREWEFSITDKCERSAKVMGDDFVHLVFESTHKVVFDAFSFIRYKGQTFFLREKYIPKPKGTFKEDSGDVSTAYYSYDVKFVSVANMLDKYVCYRHVVVSGDKGGEWNEPEININGNLETMYKIIIGSIQQVAERLSDHMEFTSMLKTIPANGLTSDGSINTKKVKLTAGTKLLTFNFSGDKIANVCTTVANNFTNDDKKDTEWYITEDNGSLTLHFSKYVDEEYGVQYVSDYISNNNGADSSVHPQKSGGLKDVDYAQEWSGITNVIVPYGSTRNMTYQAAKGIDEVTQMQSTFGKRLRLKPNTYYYVQNKDGKDVSFLTDKQGAVRNSSVDTGIEEVRFYDEIYPQGHFKVTSVETKNKRQDGEIVPEYTVAGVAIDSNGNEIQPAEGFYPIAIEEGTTLSVRFEKGLLNGREFEIANKTRKDEGRTTYSLKFTIVADGSLEDGTLIPSGNFIPREGDEFALFNMKMPEVYITAAEKELAQRVYSDLEEAVSKRPEVKCTTDPTSWDKEMALGYQFQVKSEKFNSEDTFVSRVISYSYKLTKPKEIQFNLASAVMQGTLSHMNDLIVDVTNQAGGLEQRAINLSRRGWRDAAEMAEMVDSLAADMMLVGNEKYQFAFTAGIEIVNSNNQTTAIKIGEGTLQHTQDPYISDYTCQGWWSHGAVTLNNGHTENGSASLVSLPDTPFYLYAVVGQNSDNISFELQDKEQDGEAYLLLGILSSAFTDTISGVTTNYRVFNRTNGYTQISGGTITTEQIQDPGRNLIIDFQSKRIIARNGAEIIGNIKFKASDEKTAEEQLTELGIDVGKAQQAAEEAKNMEIGGTNLVQGTSSGYGWTGFDEYGVEDGIFYCKNINKGNDGAQIYSPKNIVLSANSDYTISFEMKASSDIRRVQFYFINYLNSSSFESIYYTEIANKDVSTEWKKYKFNFKPTKNITSGCLRFDNDGLVGSTGNTELWLRRIKLEKGTVATDWTPAPEDYMNAIAESEGKINKELASQVATINGGIDELQKQIDGEVSSYFYDTAPIDEDETILTDIPPFNEWAENYNLQNGVYVLKSGARNEFVNHIGDTYTNMEEYKEDSNGNTTTPLAGLSWRWCDATTVSPLPKQYITIRYTSNGSTITKQLHWHKIADSDAVKALQEAAKAQSTADGKSTTFVAEPKNYDIGDLWILAADRTLNGNTYKQGTILTANAASATFVASHWGEKVKYIDESIAAQQAQQALDGLEIGGENLVLESKGDSNKNIMAYNASTSSEFQYSCVPYNGGTYGDELKIGLTCSTQGKYAPDSYSYTTCIWVQCKKETIKGKKYTISFDARLLESSANTNCTVYFRAAGTGYSTAQMGKAIIDKTKKRYSITVDSNAESDTNTYSYFTLFIDRVTTIYISNVKVEQGNKATGWSPAPEDVDSKSDAIKAIAEEALEDAAASNTQLANMSDDSILTPQEKGSVADEWKCIQQEHDQNESNKDAAWGNATVAEWTTYNNAYTTLQTYVGTLELTDRTNNTNINKSTFQTNFANYYSANVAFLNALAIKVAELEVAAMEIGGSNLLKDSDFKTDSLTGFWIYNSNESVADKKAYTLSYDTKNKCLKVETTKAYTSLTDTGYRLVLSALSRAVSTWSGIKAGENYMLSFDVWASKATEMRCHIGYGTSTTKQIGTEKTRFVAPIKHSYTGGTYYQNIFFLVKDICTFYIDNVKLEKGTKATDWTPAAEDVDAKVSALDYLKKALENDTDIAGGIVATTHISLRDWTGEYESDGKTKKYKVNAGLSGIKDDNILVFGGGTYEEAVNAADPDNDFHVGKNKTGRQITSLIKKDGTGKIGIFKISETQAVVDVQGQGKVIIDASTTNGGIRVLNSSGRINAALLPTSISSFKPLANNSVIGSEQSVYYSMSTQSVTSTSKTISLTRTGSFTTSGTTTETLEQYTKKTTITTASTRVGGNTVTLNGDIRTSNHDMFVRVTCELLYNGNSIYSINHTEEVQVGYNYISLSNVQLSFPNSITKALTVSNSINMQLKVTVTITGASSGAYIDAVSLNVSMGSIYMYYKAYTSTTYTYPPQTIIGSDGLISLVSNSKYFMVDNSGSTQKIYAKGLGTSGDSGQLIKKSGAYKAFAQSLVEFMHKYIKDTAKVSGFSTALNALAEDLPDDVFITAVE